MPISDDEIESSNMQEPQRNISSMSKAELRKSHKPIMEKRRRAKINNFLSEIKSLILEAMNKDPARHTKLEKADILEMAVKHLQNVQRQQMALAMANDPSVIRKFKTGFKECATEIDNFLENTEAITKSMRDRVSDHLQNYINKLEQAAQFAIPGVEPISLISGRNILCGPQNIDGSPDDQNNNPRIQMTHTIPLIPSRLPTGQLALLLPNSSNFSYFPSHSLSHQPSAFVTVTPQSNDNQKISSPQHSPKESRSESPKGFRPIHSTSTFRSSCCRNEDHQVPCISSSTVEHNEANRNLFNRTLELKTVKFPMQKSLATEKKSTEYFGVIKNVSEPLRIITNQDERYKQAQRIEDSIYLEENQVPQRGIRRDYNQMLQYHNDSMMQSQAEGQPSKLLKTSHGTIPVFATAPSCSGTQNLKEEKVVITGAKPESSPPKIQLNLHRLSPRVECNDDNNANNAQQHDNNNDMWRPW